MGQAEGEYRGDTDTVLRAAIEKIPDDKFEEFLSKAEQIGMLKASDYKNKIDLLNGLEKIGEDEKESVAEDLR